MLAICLHAFLLTWLIAFLFASTVSICLLAFKIISCLLSFLLCFLSSLVPGILTISLPACLLSYLHTFLQVTCPLSSVLRFIHFCTVRACISAFLITRILKVFAFRIPDFCLLALSLPYLLTFLEYAIILPVLLPYLSAYLHFAGLLSSVISCKNFSNLVSAFLLTHSFAIIFVSCRFALLFPNFFPKEFLPLDCFFHASIAASVPFIR